MRVPKVLVACETSAVVRNAFTARGWNATSVDLLPCEEPDIETSFGGIGRHIVGDAVDAMYNERYDLLIAHPPCTYLSASGMHWTTRGLRDPQLTEDAVTFAQKFFSAFHIPFRCIENPVSVLSTRIRKPTQIVQPYEYGHDASKRTCLWLDNLPKITPTAYVQPRIVNGKPRWSNQTDSGQNRLPPSELRWKERSRTYKGIAEAMAYQWSKFLTESKGYSGLLLNPYIISA